MSRDSFYYDPLSRRAEMIADQLDRGNPNMAADIMRDELYYLNRNPSAQKRLVSLVDAYERKGWGADLQVRPFENGCSVYGAVSVVGRQPDFMNLPNYVRPPQFFRQSVGTIYLGENRYCDDRRYYDDRRYDDRRYHHYNDRNQDYDDRRYYQQFKR